MSRSYEMGVEIRGHDPERESHIKQAAKDEHQRLALFSPWWEVALTEDLDPAMPIPAGTTFKPCEVPWSLPNNTPHVNCAYLRCKFALPDGAADRVARLVVETVTDEATAYINGKRVGNVRGAGAPTRTSAPGWTRAA